MPTKSRIGRSSDSNTLLCQLHKPGSPNETFNKSQYCCVSCLSWCGRFRVKHSPALPTTTIAAFRGRPAGDLDGAIADYTKAIELDPNDLDSHNNRGLARQAKGDFDGAIADHTKAIELNPRDPDGYYNRGISRKAKGDLDGAIADFTKVIEIDPRYASAYINRGTIRMDKSDSEGAIAEFTKAIEIDPRSVSGYYNRGIVRIWQGRY